MKNRFIIIWVLGAVVAFLTVGAGQSAEPVASQPAPKSATNAGTAAKSAKAKIDLNQASAEELQTLPGIGPSTAQAIIKARPFKSINELSNVAGIGPTKFSALKSRVVVKPTAVSAGKTAKPASGTVGSAGGTTEKSAGKSADSAITEHKATSSTAPPSKSAVPLTQKVNLNTASLEQLEQLPGIGPVKAQAIIDARPFSTIEDVMKVKGIKEGVFNKIKDNITVK